MSYANQFRLTLDFEISGRSHSAGAFKTEPTWNCKHRFSRVRLLPCEGMIGGSMPEH
jgi:hypothetical protein